MARAWLTTGHLRSKPRNAWRAATAWLLAFALFVQAFMPLANAWAYESNADGVQVICTANGVQTIAVDRDGNPLEPQQSVQTSCPFCVLHVSAAVLAPTLSGPSTRIEETATRVSYRTEADLQVSIWRALPRPPRGPPA